MPWVLPLLGPFIVIILLFTFGPSVSGVEHGSLTVRCRYDPGWETYVKWWCRGAAWSSSRFVVKTTGSEKEVKKGRVSIKDNLEDHSINPTMEKLRLDDSDTYWCGIGKSGTDLGDHVDMTIDPGKSVCVCVCVCVFRACSVPQRDCWHQSYASLMEWIMTCIFFSFVPEFF
uniref:Immunoglobulin domain-containing protein n=1 Tax=Moschus moschiferus TaxID=68415 RepID=A0A8C6DS54_MOSMO